MAELAFLGIAEASRPIADRKLSPVELTEACLGRIAALDSQLDSFVTLTADRARAEAKAAEAAIMASDPVSRLRGMAGHRGRGEEIAQRAGDVALLLGGKLGEDGQGEEFGGEGLGHREAAGAIAEIGVGRLQMDSADPSQGG